MTSAIPSVKQYKNPNTDYRKQCNHVWSDGFEPGSSFGFCNLLLYALLLLLLNSFKSEITVSYEIVVTIKKGGRHKHSDGYRLFSTDAICCDRQFTIHEFDRCLVTVCIIPYVEGIPVNRFRKGKFCGKGICSLWPVVSHKGPEKLGPLTP